MHALSVSRRSIHRKVLFPLSFAVAAAAGGTAAYAAAAGTERSVGLDGTKAVNTAAIVANGATTKNWLAYGLDYSGKRFSRLTRINTGTVDKLGLAWTFNLASTHHGVEATPIVVNGVMYVTAPWNVVYALDAATGRQIWVYDPEVPRGTAVRACCDVVNRGVAVYKGRVYEGTLDGRLIALDAATGKLDWSVDALPSGEHNATTTSAPLAARGKILIGYGGAEYFGTRGSIAAFNATTGALEWRWYSVPGDPAKGYTSEPVLAQAAKTWDPSTKYWLKGGGGTIWQSFSYDPALGLVYFGTGNADPWNRMARGGPKFHSLYTSSIVALNLDTGKFAWGYQTTPADFSDYDADQDVTLATLRINGKDTPVVINANKNGFLYVLNRANGHFISATEYLPQNWAKGYASDGTVIPSDVLTEEVDKGKPFQSIPGPFAGHNWQAVSFSPETGLLYIPAQNFPSALVPESTTAESRTRVGGAMSGNAWNLGMGFGQATSKAFGRLIAWNPVTQKAAWEHDYPAPWNGGTLVTAGNLVFQGTATGELVAYDATTGRELWHAPLGQGAIAPPVTYEIGGKQYVAIAVGWGGVAGALFRATDTQGPGTVFAFEIGGAAKPPVFQKIATPPLLAGMKYSPQDAKAGAAIYMGHCFICHGAPGMNTGGSIPNLGYAGKSVIEGLSSIVFKGPFFDNGMPDFTGKLTSADITKLQAYIQSSSDSFAVQRKTGKGGDASGSR